MSHPLRSLDDRSAVWMPREDHIAGSGRSLLAANAGVSSRRSLELIGINA